MSNVFVAKVKNVVSGDTVVLVPAKTTQFPVPERLLTLSDVRSCDSFQSKEWMRQLLIGKEIKFRVLFKHPTSGKEFGDIQSPIFKSLIEYALEKGVVKLKDNVQDDSENVEQLLGLENKAKLAHEGLWNEEFCKNDRIDVVSVDEAIMAKSQKSPITTIVEKVISGDRIMGRIIVNKTQHITTPLLLAGIKCPRTDDTESAHITKTAQQAKAFVEEKLLTTKATIKVSIIGESQAGIPIAIFHHPSGNNIHAKLLESGLGEIVDWQSSLVGSATMGELRRAEQTAKALAKGLYSTSKPSQSSTPSKQTSKALKPGSTVANASIAKVIGADTLIVRLPTTEEELTVQLASIRAPKPSDTTVTTNHQQQLALVNTAREFVRQQVIGKTGTISIDGYKEANKEMGFDARFLISFKINGNNDLSELIINNGMGTVIKHNKATSHERSMNWDKLIELEEEQKKAGKKGVFFNGNDISKVLTVGTRIVDASENATKAKTFFNGFKQKGRIASGYYVEFIPSLNRVKLFNPKEGLKLTLILGGLSNNKNDALSEEGLKYMNKKFLQRNVEFEVYDMDKIGGFIGNLYANSNSLVPAQVALLEQGLVSVHDLAVNSNPFADKLIETEESAKTAKKGIWSNYDPSKAQEELDTANAKLNELRLDSSKPKFFDIEVTDIDASGTISFHQLDTASVNTFTSFKTQFGDFHSQAPSASNTSVDLPHNLTKPPKKGELVSAKFSENGKYYRAKVLSYDKTTKNFEVKHLDFGNVDKAPLSALRVLPSRFNTTQFPRFASTCVLQNLRLPPTKPTDYLTDALYALEDLTFDKKLVISALPSTTPNVDYSAVLYDSEESLKDSTYTINKQLVSEGWAVVDTTTVSPANKEYIDQLQKAQQHAKSTHLGCWEFGDVSFDEDDTLI